MPLSGKQAHGPQHQVKPAASTEKQPGGRAAHLTAKATPVAQEPERAKGSGGVRGAWHVCKESCGTGEARLGCRRRGKVARISRRRKSSAAERESEGIVVPSRAVSERTNAAGGKGPCSGHVVAEEVSARAWPARPVPTTPAGREPVDKVRQLQRTTVWCSQAVTHPPFPRAVFDRIYRRDVLWEAWERVKRKRGAAGLDAQSVEDVEEYGAERLIEELGDVLRSRRVSSAGGDAAVHPERGWKEAAPGHPDGEGSGGADGGEAGAGAHLRGGFSCRARMASGRSGARRWRWRRCARQPTGTITCSTPTSGTSSGASTKTS